MYAPPTLEEVEKWDWMSEVSPVISRTNARRIGGYSLVDEIRPLARIAHTSRVHWKYLASLRLQQLLTVQSRIVFNSEIFLRVYEFRKDIRSWADTLEVFEVRGRSELCGTTITLLITRDDLRPVVRKFTVRPSTSNIHTHIPGRNLDGRIRHPPSSVRARRRMGITTSDAWNSPSDGPSNRMRTTLGLASFGGIGERNRDADPGLEIPGVVDDSEMMSRNVPESSSSGRRGHRLEFVVVTRDLGIAGLDPASAWLVNKPSRDLTIALLNRLILARWIPPKPLPRVASKVLFASPRVDQVKALH